MAKYTKAQLLRLRENTNNLLRKMEKDEKDKYERLSLSFKNSQATIDRILEKIEGDKTYDQIAVLLKGLQSDISEAIKSTKVDMEPVVKAVDGLAGSIAKAYSSKEVVVTLNRLEKLLSKKPKEKEVKDRTDEIIKAIKAIRIEAKDIEFPKSISVDNFPPTKTPMPATNININPLRGYIHTTSQTLSTTLNKIPSYGELENRRALLIYNNSSSIIYIGGSTVTSSDGLPVPAKSYSPILDASTRMIVYGVTSSGTATIRAMEISNEATGG